MIKWSRARLALAIAVIVLAGGVAGMELRDGLTTDESAETQIRSLESFWPSRRKGAATQLGQFPNEADKAVAALIRALSDSDVGVRLSAVESLKRYNDKSKPAAPALREMLKREHDGRIRQGIVSLLGMTKDQDSVPLIVGAFDDDDPAIRLEATRALGMFSTGVGSGPIFDRLISALAPDRPADLREASIATLSSLGQDQESVVCAIARAATSDPSDQVRYVAVGVLKKAKFGCEIPALLAALEDQSARVRLIAGGNLAWIGLIDDRIAPALCKAALNAEKLTREGIGINFNLLYLDRISDKPGQSVTPIFQGAVNAFRTVIETRDAAGREQVLSVLGRLIAVYLSKYNPSLLEPARGAAKAVLARMEDETEDIPIRLAAMEQWTLINLESAASAARSRASQSTVQARKDELHPKALWIEAMSRMLSSPCADVRSRAGYILIDNVNDTDFDPAFREAWRRAVPALAKAATQVDDVTARGGALAILTKLGPEAREALPALRLLEKGSDDGPVSSAAKAAARSISSVDDLKSSDPTVRAAAAAAIGRLGWPATPAVTALAGLLKDSESAVRLAAAKALESLGPVARPAIPVMAAALPSEADAAIRATIVESLDAIAPDSSQAIEIHLLALRDSSPDVRKVGARLNMVPADASLVTALEKALADADPGVRLKVARSLSEALFENATIIPALLNGLGDPTQRKAVFEALGESLGQTSDAAAFKRAGRNLSALKSTLGSAIPALTKALAATDQETRAVVYRLLGRIASFSGLTRDQGLQKMVEPAFHAYLGGLEGSDPVVRQDVISRLDLIPIAQGETVKALQEFLARSDLSVDERETAAALLEDKAAPPRSAAAPRPRRSTGQGAGMFRLHE
jgi:HEAT repeat protein